MAASDVAAWATVLGSIEQGVTGDAARIDLIRALEQVKCAAAGAQAQLAADFDASQRSPAARAGVPVERRGRGIANQVALARRESPHRGQRHLGLAKVLCRELPHTFAVLRAGRITEWAATLLARETACLELSDRMRIDAQLAGDPERIAAMSETAYAGAPGGQVAMDSRARRVPQGLADHLRVRDAGTCRTPWCDAPIRHSDHVTAVEFGGPTSVVNLQGLCVACNHAKQAPGWSALGEHRPGERHRVRTTTPTGHTYDSTAPPLPGHEPGQARRRADFHFTPDLQIEYRPAA